MESIRYLKMVLRHVDGNRPLTMGALRDIVLEAEKAYKMSMQCGCDECKRREAYEDRRDL